MADLYQTIFNKQIVGTHIFGRRTAVTYDYDANRNLIKVTDRAGRVTSYIYDVNNRVVEPSSPTEALCLPYMIHRTELPPRQRGPSAATL